MIIRVCAFSDKGYLLADRIKDLLCSEIVEIKEKNSDADIDSWIKYSFDNRLPILFIGASGIAVRKIAPYVNDKLKDSPVIVMDEKGQYVIPILSGHMGGANDIARMIADRSGAVCVLTTGTDVEGLFAIDTFAKNYGFAITDRSKIVTVNSMILKGQELELSYDEDSITVSGLKLTFKPYILGVGCKKGIDASIIEKRVLEEIHNCDLCVDKYKYSLLANNEGTADDRSLSMIIRDKFAAIASIDLKAKEYGLNLFAHRNGIKLMTFSKDELNAVEGEFSQSAFVSEITGTDNVCERAAMAAAGAMKVNTIKVDNVDASAVAAGDGEIVLHKQGKDGVTVSIVKRKFDGAKWISDIYIRQ